MTTLLEEPTTTSPAQRLRARMAAVRLSVSFFGVRKTLTLEQRSQAAETFGAEGTFLAAGKKLIDTGHPVFKQVTSAKNRALAFWRGCTLPFPEGGVRLIRQDDIPTFNARMTTLQQELQQAVAQLQRHYAELRAAARQRLGSLFNPADYPDSLDGLFSLSWDFPSVEPPDYLRQLSPDLYRQECQRVASRFDEAVRLAEEAFTTEFARLISHLTERLSGQADGRPKVFRDSAVDHLLDFFDRFRQLGIRSDAQLDELVAQAQQIIRGIEPQQLRQSPSLRDHVVTELTEVQNVLDELLVDRPRRNILRRPRSPEALPCSS